MGGTGLASILANFLIRIDWMRCEMEYYILLAICTIICFLILYSEKDGSSMTKDEELGCTFFGILAALALCGILWRLMV